MGNKPIKGLNQILQAPCTKRYNKGDYTSNIYRAKRIKKTLENLPPFLKAPKNNLGVEQLRLNLIPNR